MTLQRPADLSAETEPTAEPGDTTSAPDLRLVNDQGARLYEAIAGDTVVAGLAYNVAGDDRLVLMSTSVFPEFRKRGIATTLIRLVLDDVRVQGKTVTIMCPIVRAFIEHHPDYTDLVDRKRPGVATGSHHQ